MGERTDMIETLTQERDALRREIAARQAHDLALAAQQELLETLLAVARTSPDGSALDATLQKMLDVSSRLTGATNGSLFLLGDDGTVTHSILTRRDATVEQRRAIIGSVMERGLSLWVVRTRQVGLIVDTQCDDRWFTLPYEPYSFRSALAVPLLRGRRLLGILNLLHAEPGHFEAAHAQLMQIAADQMALALENAHLYTAAQQELAERRRAEQALQHANRELAAAKQQLERWMEARANETSAAVHDMRHGVRDVMSKLELLGLDLADAGVPKATFGAGVRGIEDALDALLTLLSDMLDAAMLQSNALVLNPAATDLADLVAQVAQRLEARCRMFGCTLTIASDGPLPPAWCDERRMARVLYNVLHNAVQYSTDRDDDTPSEVRVTLAEDGDQLVCRVADNGPGIAQEQLARLGERFARLASGARAVEGTGLGLNFCIGITKLHGGTFEIASPGLGYGTTVTLRLPQAQATREAQQ